MNLQIDPNQLVSVAGLTSITTFRNTGRETLDLFYILENADITQLEDVEVRITNQGVVLYPLDMKQSNLMVEELLSHDSIAEK